jgi:hypothetical protein
MARSAPLEVLRRFGPRRQVARTKRLTGPLEVRRPCDRRRARGAPRRTRNGQNRQEPRIVAQHPNQSIDQAINSCAPSKSVVCHIDKSTLPLSEPRRYRDREHLKFVSSQACLLCGRRPSDAHHLRFAQPRALGRRVSDEFAVPLCRTHHRVLHSRGDEAAWWESVKLDPVAVARQLWEHSRLNEAPAHRKIGTPLHGAPATIVQDPEAAAGLQRVDGAGTDLPEA